ncbi:MAG: hypothetical protein EPN20_21110, partial [Magnetospirillum sp.]
MITPLEAARSLYGAVLLLRRDPAGLAWFDSSRRGVIQSFWAAALVLPAFIILELAEGSFSKNAGPLRALAIEAAGFVIFWTAFPLVMATIADSLDRGRFWPRFTTAYNWSGAVQMAVYFPAGLMAALFPGAGTGLVSLVITAFLLAYQGYVAHKALEIPF